MVSGPSALRLTRPGPSVIIVGMSDQASDVNVVAHRTVQSVIDKTEPTPPKNPAAVALGRLGGLKGGKARADRLTPEQRAEIARKGAQARWGNRTRTAEEGR